MDNSQVLDNLMETHTDKNELMHTLARLSGYCERVPDIDTFIEDPFYLGKILGDTVYPIWREAARKLYPTPYHTVATEVYLTGGIGLGKSTFAKIIVAYDMCKLLCLQDPGRYYGLMETTIIRYMLMNATKSLGFDVLYAELIEWFENSPFFKERMSKDKRTVFTKKLDIGFGSRGKDALGQATVGAIFSEINDMTVVGGQAEDNFDTISTRMNSRFGGKGRDMIGHLILDSSNKGAKSFIDVRLEEKQKKGITDYILFRYAHWEAKWHLGAYSGKFFKVYAGDENRDPFIMPEDLDPQIMEGLKPHRILDVPVEHHQEFHFNIVKSLRDLAGVSTYSTFSFISSNQVLVDCFTHINPVTKDVIVLDFFNEDQKLLQFIDIAKLTFLCGQPRFIHIDLGLKHDSTGIACTYLEGYSDVEKFDEVSGRKIFNREPKYCTEWVMEIVPVPGHEVPIYKIKNFLLEARSMGYPIKLVSTDGYQSSNLRQDLILRKMDAQLISVDRNKDPYDNLRNAMFEGRQKLPKNDKLLNELRELEDVGPKYDHPTKGSKDLCDAVCGSVWICAQNLSKGSTLVDSKSLVKSLDALTSSLNRGPVSESTFKNILTRGH